MKQTLRRLLALVLSLFVLSLLVFTVARLSPGDPLQAYYGEGVERLSPAERAQATERLGLNENPASQYAHWLAGVLRGDFGLSYRYKAPALEVIAGRLGNSLILGGGAFVLIFALALPLGVWCAARAGRASERVLRAAGTLSACIPEFWLALLFIYMFSIRLGWLPSSGATSLGGGGRLRHLILPMSVLVLGHLWYYAYLARNFVLEEMREDYTLLAAAKGLSTRQVLWRHCVRTALPAYISLAAASAAHIFGGTVIVETVFSYPGLGTLAVESAKLHDYNLLMLICLITGAFVIVINAAGQTFAERLDPRMQEARSCV